MTSNTIRLNDTDPGGEGNATADLFLPIPQFSFDNFIPLKNNRFALSVTMGVAENPGTDHNPLTIYGKVGHGKTHLLHAIGNTILATHPETKVCCFDTHLFINRFFLGHRHGDLNNLRRRLFAADVLLLDNLHSLAGKTRPQEELIDLLGILVEARKQIVVTTGEHLKEISHLDDRLATILCEGLFADIEEVEDDDCLMFIEHEGQRLGKPSLSPKRIDHVAGLLDWRSSPRTIIGAMIKLRALDSLNVLNMNSLCDL